MSTQVPDFSNLFFSSDKSVELIKKITDRTRQGKIVWQKTGNGLAAHVPGKLHMSFIEAPFSILSSPRWVLFVVREESGNQVLKVENKDSGVPTGSIPLAALLVGGDPLVRAVTELHNLILNRVTKGVVERAIDALDSI